MRSKPPDTFASRLRALRAEASLSATDLAERAGISPQYLCDLESGRRADPRLSLLVRLADSLGVELDVFRGD